jgi:uncharacterized YccA/Bax inhibitor family protein
MANNKDNFIPTVDTKNIRGLYPSMMSHFLHQDNMMWDLSKIVIAVQGATLASSWGLHIENIYLSIALLLLGAIITFALNFLVKNTKKDRNVNIRLMDTVAENLFSEKDKLKLQDAGIDYRIRVAVQRNYKGGSLISHILWGFIVIDLFLIFLYSQGVL